MNLLIRLFISIFLVLTSTGCLIGTHARHQVRTGFFDDNTRKDIPVFLNTVANAESVEIVELKLATTAYLSLMTHAWLSGPQEREIHELGENAISNAKTKLKPNHQLIINNIQIEGKGNALLEFWNSYFPGWIYIYEPVRIVFEIAQIPKNVLTAYVNGETPKVAQTETIRAKQQIFKGIVFAVNGNQITIVSPLLGILRQGTKLEIQDRNGNISGHIVVEQTFHTKVTARLTDGRADKGFNALLFK